MRVKQIYSFNIGIPICSGCRSIYNGIWSATASRAQ